MDFSAVYTPQNNADHAYVCKNCKNSFCGKYLLEPRCPYCGAILTSANKVGWYTREQEFKIAERILEKME